MSYFFEEFTLKNLDDLGCFHNGHIKEEDVRTATIQAMPDTGASWIYITDDLRQKLGLRIVGDKKTLIGDGQYKASKKTQPVEIHWKDRDAICHAVVLEGLPHLLVGSLVLAMLDLRVNPVKQCLEGAHGDEPLDLCL